MKKNNLFALLFLCLAVTLGLLLPRWLSSPQKPLDIPVYPEETITEPPTEPTAAPTTPTEPTAAPTEPTEPPTEPTAAPTKPTEPPTEPTAAPTEPTKPAETTGSLFIGDSRTVGIMEYAGLDDTDFFCNVGMNVFSVRKDRNSVPGVGKVTLSELLSNKNYDKIYVMLGINELGYALQSILEQYEALLELIEQEQPDAVIFIQANLHVSQKRSNSDKVINNPALDRLNGKLKELANGKTRFYLDANPLFDDANGNLAADKTHDGAHLYAKYYAQWGEWICRESTKYLDKG